MDRSTVMKSKPVSLDETRRIYESFLSGDTLQAMMATLSLPQVYLDHVVGHYLPGGEEDLNDPRLFARVMHFRDVLISCQAGDSSKLPRLAYLRDETYPEGYEAATDTILLQQDISRDLTAIVKQIEDALPTVLISRQIDR